MSRFYLAICLWVLLVPLTSFSQDKAETIQKHAQQMKEIGDLLKQPERIATDTDKHLENLKAINGYRQLVDELKKTYGNRMNTNQKPMSDLYNSWNYAERELREYERYAKMYASPQEVEAILTRCLNGAKQGVANQAPAYFKPDNDIARGFIDADRRLIAIEAIDPKSKDVPRLRASLVTTKKEVQKIAEGLRKAIIEGNELPPDDYNGPDKGELVKLLDAKWTKEGNGQKVLKIGIVTAQWTRGISWQRVSTEWQKSDKSRIQGYVITQLDSTTAIRYSINLVKDHLSSDRISASFLYDPKEEPEVINLIPLKKVK